MAKKRKHKYVISETNYNGDENPNKAKFWNAECLADYFFMEYYIKDEYELMENEHDEYYRSNTCLEVIPHVRRISYKNDNGRVCWKLIHYEEMLILKRSAYDNNWHEVFHTTSMDEISELFQEYNEHYYSYGWSSTYEQYVDTFY